MNCEEFELIGLDVSQSGASAEQRAAATEHLRACTKCAGLVESWEEARAELFLLGDQTREAQAPERVETRLLREFRARRRPVVLRRWTAAWGLAAAAAIAGMILWISWRRGQQTTGVKETPTSTATQGQGAKPEDVLVADNDGGAFTLLPGSIVQETDNATVMQVRMQRGALGALGLPVAQDRASDWIQVDLLVGEDGVPEAVRLHQDTLQASNVQ
jgi:hypothetical protein